MENTEIQSQSSPELRSAGPSRAEVWGMFDRIAHRYDFVNRLLSARQDVYWRKRVGSCLSENRPTEILDLATGTGDQLFTLIRKFSPKTAVGIDMSENMLARGRAKAAAAGFAVRMERGDACHIPVADTAFDAVTISFGIRNVVDVNQALREMHRALKPGGRAVVLEFSLPTNAWFRKLYLFYLRHILPRFGSVLSGDGYAYRYLNETIETFPYGATFCDLMTRAGFTQVRQVPLTFGIASIYYGDKIAWNGN